MPADDLQITAVRKPYEGQIRDLLAADDRVAKLKHAAFVCRHSDAQRLRMTRPSTWNICAIVAVCLVTHPAQALTYKARIVLPPDFDYTIITGASNTNFTGWGAGSPTGMSPHAILSNGDASGVVDLNPAGFTSSYAASTSGPHQVGWGNKFGTDPDKDHALLWAGTAASAIDLHPATFDRSEAVGLDGNRQVGFADVTPTYRHAILWSGTAESAVDLNPTGFTYSIAYSIWGANQAGVGSGPATGGNDHALLWSGSATSEVDLNPVGFDFSAVYNMYGTTQVGYGGGGSTGGAHHALLWHGTKASVVDLHPVGALWSELFGISSAGEVGSTHFGPSVGGNTHATWWNGTSSSAIDLHTYLNGLEGLTLTHSWGYAITGNGSIVGNAEDDNHMQYPILWTPESGIAGDYNNDRKVDTADYVVWRNGGPLFNEVATINSNTPDDYTEWRKRFGNTSGSGAAANPSYLAAVPEPASYALCILAALLSAARVQRQIWC